MWLATRNGLMRFDPATGRLVTYRRDMQSSTKEYYDIAEDQKGRFWLGGNNGLQQFAPPPELLLAMNINPTIPAL